MQIDIEVHDAETDANLGFVRVSFDRDGEIVISDKAGDFPVDKRFLDKAANILDATEREEIHGKHFWQISI
jgi:hypothetical protein